MRFIVESIKDIYDNLRSYRKEYKDKLRKEIILDFTKEYDKEISLAKNLQDLTPYLFKYFKDNNYDDDYDVNHLKIAFGDYSTFKSYVLGKFSAAFDLHDKQVKNYKPSGKAFTSKYVSDNWSSIYDASTDTITIPSGINKLSRTWYYKLTPSQIDDIQHLKKLIFPEGIKDIVYEFYNLSDSIGVFSIEDLILPKSLRVIGEDAFFGVDFKNPINIPEGVEEIYRDAFYSNLPLVINLPRSLKHLSSAFAVSLSKGTTWRGNITIRYSGTEAEWEKLTQDWSSKSKEEIKNNVEFI